MDVGEVEMEVGSGGEEVVVVVVRRSVGEGVAITGVVGVVEVGVVGVAGVVGEVEKAVGRVRVSVVGEGPSEYAWCLMSEGAVDNLLNCHTPEPRTMASSGSPPFTPMGSK